MSLVNQPFNEKLKAARESRGLSLADAAHKTRIPISRLVQLEEGNYAAFGSMAYARSFLRSYSKFLEVDADEVILGLPTPVLGGPDDYRHLTDSFGPWVVKRGQLGASGGISVKSRSPAVAALVLTIVVGAGFVIFASLYVIPGMMRKGTLGEPVHAVTTPPNASRPFDTGVRSSTGPVEAHPHAEAAAVAGASHPVVQYRRAEPVGAPVDSQTAAQ